MPVRQLSFPFNLKLVLGASLLVLQSVSPVAAQSGNQSDATNPWIFNPGTVVPLRRFPSDVQLTVDKAAVTLIDLLRQNNLTDITGAAIPPEVQAAILNILIGGEQSASSTSAVTDALANAPGAPPLSEIKKLVASLKELIQEEKTVTAINLLAAVSAYNSLILASKEEFLANPPAELLAIQAVLAQLVVAAK